MRFSASLLLQLRQHRQQTDTENWLYCINLSILWKLQHMIYDMHFVVHLYTQQETKNT